MPYRLLLIIALCLFQGESIASPDIHFGAKPAWVRSVKPNDRQPNLRDVNDGYYLKLYEEEINADKDETYYHSIKDIISEAGIQEVSSLSVNFNPAYEQLTFHEVTVWRDGKPIDKLQKDAFKVIAVEHELSMFIYHGNYTAYVILKDIRSGDKVEYAYTISGSNPIFPRQLSTSFTFQGSDPISQIHYCIVAPSSRTLGFRYFNNAPKPVVLVTKNSTVYDWELLNVKNLEYSSNAPGWFTPSPYVQVSEYRNWREVADWAYKINIPEEHLQGEAGKCVARLTGLYGKDSAGLFRAITEIVQNEVRYMGVEIGAYSHKANSPEKVYEQRYGDCKDKSLLLVSMLHNAGFSAEMALVNSVKRRKTGEDHLPTPFAFNHAIVLAHMSGKDIWIDPTISYQGGTGTDFYCPDYGKALVLKPGTDSLTSLPDMPGGDIKYTEEYEAKDANKPVHLTVYTTYSYSSADDIRENFANKSTSDLEKNFLEYYTKIYPHIQSADTLTINDDKRANILQTIERYSIPDFFEFDSVNYNYPVSFYAHMIKNMLPVVGSKKQYPISVTYPYNLHCIVRLNAPFSWSIAHSNENILRKAYRFTSDVSATDHTLSLDYTFAFLKDHIATDEIADYEKDRKKLVNELLSYSITYTPAGSSRYTGPNYLSIISFILLLGGCTYAAIRIYKTKTSADISLYRQPAALGGWLILPLLGLFYSAFSIGYLMVTSGFFNNATWHAYDRYKENIQFRMLLGMEFLVNSALWVLTIFCIVLMFKKRDILPKSMIVLYAAHTIFILIDSIWAHALSPDSTIEYNSIFRTLVGVSIWVPYFSMSPRVKETFIVPYPEARNYVHQGNPL